MRRLSGSSPPNGAAIAAPVFTKGVNIMLEAYGLNITATANAPIPFSDVSIRKGCTAILASPATINLNTCGVYMVSFDCSAAAALTVQLYKDGVAQPQAQSTGTTPHFTTLVQVDRNNNGCICSSPTTIQVMALDAGTITDANIVVTKVC